MASLSFQEEISEIISQKKNTFRFNSSNYCNYLPPDENYWCDLTVTVSLKKYKDSRMFYYIEYAYNFSPNNTTSTTYLCNPLVNLMEDKHLYEGDIIVANSLSEKLMEYILMDFKDLKKHSGTPSVEEYKISLMECVHKLWD